MSAREFRFLRKQAGFTQEQLSRKLRVDAQTIARYEKDQTAIPGSADAMLRFLYAVHLIPEDQRRDVLAELAGALEDRGARPGPAMHIRRTRDRWDRAVWLHRVWCLHRMGRNLETR